MMTDISPTLKTKHWVKKLMHSAVFVFVFSLSSSVLGIPAVLRTPTKTKTPYGLRVTWCMPGRNPLVVHFKDSEKIRNKKRWSQV